jgi:hypothetical protein
MVGEILYHMQIQLLLQLLKPQLNKLISFSTSIVLSGIRTRILETPWDYRRNKIRRDTTSRNQEYIWGYSYRVQHIWESERGFVTHLSCYLGLISGSNLRHHFQEVGNHSIRSEKFFRMPGLDKKDTQYNVQVE